MKKTKFNNKSYYIAASGSVIEDIEDNGLSFSDLSSSTTKLSQKVKVMCYVVSSMIAAGEKLAVIKGLKKEALVGPTFDELYLEYGLNIPNMDITRDCLSLMNLGEKKSSPKVVKANR